MRSSCKISGGRGKEEMKMNSGIFHSQLYCALVLNNAGCIFLWIAILFVKQEVIYWRVPIPGTICWSCSALLLFGCECLNLELQMVSLCKLKKIYVIKFCFLKFKISVTTKIRKVLFFPEVIQHLCKLKKEEVKKR